MKRWLFLLVALLVGCEKPQPVAPMLTPTADLPAILAFGDSLTAGLGVDEDQSYPAQLQRKLQANGYPWRVVNAGLGGETTRGALTRVEWVMRVHPKVVILEFGANDGLRGLDPTLLQQNLVRLVRTVKAHQARVLLVGMHAVTNMGPRYTVAFKAVYPAVAEEEHVPLMPFFLESVAHDDALRQGDGLHPTAAGYTRIVDDLYPYLIPLLQ